MTIRKIYDELYVSISRFGDSPGNKKIITSSKTNIHNGEEKSLFLTTSSAARRSLRERAGNFRETSFMCGRAMRS